MTYEESKKMYSDIIETIKKYGDNSIFNPNEFETLSKYHLFGIELKERYGFNIDPKKINSIDYNKFGEYMTICIWGEKYKRTISFPDDGRQPEDELLLKIGFSTGAYIFGSDYPTIYFQKFFQELKSYNPKYIDSANHSLFFSMENASIVFNKFDTILKKYHELNKEDFKQRKIIRLKEELDCLCNVKETKDDIQTA